MDLSNSYYILEPENNNNYPMFSWDEPSFRPNEEVVRSQPVRLRLGKPIPKKPQLVDYHTLPRPVFSTKIRDVLTPLNLFQVQLVQANVPVDGRVFEYWILHVRRCFEALDMKRSRYQPDLDGSILIPEKVVLDAKKLAKVPLERRLLFRPQEYGTMWLYHESVKDVIESVKPVGLRFFSLRDWGDTVAFR